MLSNSGKFPRLLKRRFSLSNRHLHSQIDDIDIIYRHPNSDFVAVRMKTEHIPIVYPIVEEFFRKFTNNEIRTSELEGFLQNVTKISYFLIEKRKRKAEAVFLQEIVYKNPRSDPIRREHENPTENRSLRNFYNILRIAEERTFGLKPNVCQVLHTKMSFSSDSLEKQGLSELLPLIGVSENVEINGPIHGVDHCIEVASCRKIKRNLESTGFDVLEELPRIHSNSDAFLTYLDLKKAQEWNLRNCWTNVENSKFIHGSSFALF